MDNIHHSSFPSVSRSGRILKKSIKWIEAEESLLTQACLTEIPQNEPESFIDVVHCCDVVDNGVNENSKMPDSESDPDSNHSISVSSTANDETSVSFKGTFPSFDAVKKFSYKKRFDSTHNREETRSNSFSSVDEGEPSSRSAFHRYDRRENVLCKKLFDVKNPDSICSTSFSSLEEDEARKPFHNIFHCFDTRNNKKMPNFYPCPHSTYSDSSLSIDEGKTHNSFAASSDVMRNILSIKMGEFDSEIRPVSPGTISIYSVDDDEEERIASAESHLVSENSHQTSSSSESHSHDEKIDCPKPDRYDHRYCTRFQHAQKSGVMNVATNSSTRNTRMSTATKARTTNVTAYKLWSSLNRRVIAAANRQLPRRKISKKVREAWQALPTEEKQFWAEKADEIAERMQVQLVCSDSIEGTNVHKNSTSEAPLKKREENICSNWKKNLRRNYEEEHNLDYDASLGNNPLKKKCEEQHVLGIAPADVAAHLKLLGDSLTAIGQKIMMTHSEPSPAGVYSVLLDSLLCSVGALLCLSREIPGLQQLPEDSFKKTLDHVAYFFPGL